MQLSFLDWGILFLFFAISLGVGFWASKQAGKDSLSFFLSGRNMPWYLLGVSMVATTFSVDTPTLVSDIVRQNGVSGNWVWWAFLMTGMLTVFVYSKLWRRSEVITDVEFYEIRYSGRMASFLRGFRSIYLGVVFNVAIMAAVTLAAIKVGGVMLGLSPVQVILLAGGVTVVFSSMGGFLGVIVTDFILFLAAMAGSILAAVYAVHHPKVGGLANLLSHPEVADKLAFFPDFNHWELAVVVFIIPVTVQWWSVWYSGAEPGGGGYVVQRMLAAKNENHAMGATLLFNVAHYAIRPWPWIVVALCSLVVFPDLEAIRSAFPDLDPSIIGHDLAYPAMLTLLPAGLVGLVFASLLAAYMSTMSSCLNLGSSYLVNDLYKRFIKPEAEEKELVAVGRISTLLLMLIASVLALFLQNALSAFNLLLQIGAGTGLLFILRWFWYRINPYSELTAMLVSFLVALGFMVLENHQSGQVQALIGLGMDPESAAAQIRPLKTHVQLLLGVGITTFSWLLVTLLTRPSSMDTLEAFYRRVRPGRIGWRKIIEYAASQDRHFSKHEKHSDIPQGVLGMVLGCMAVYSALFATGSWIYGHVAIAVWLSLSALITSWLVFRIWSRMNPPEGRQASDL
ncbi:sodium-solute symporter, putative [Lunatimonas lonarensis]|uniref:Sodium-solute symporter, putative n=1 Tax=Lunatimonas lonarensis TaxID=1232681 RepID=R7ZW26_9BACT|nr:sodium:solute symporter family protein [Lunatimonas lonarensis]EON78350.1 sodium-solute symporter, putative [Lunatimonas lonarensis]